MKLTEKYFDELLSEIENAKSSNCLIIAEGKKDRAALENLGLKNIFVLNETSKSICEKIEEISGKDANASYSKAYSKDEIFYVSCSNAKAKKLLGWAPRYDLKKGLEETYHYYLNEMEAS